MKKRYMILAGLLALTVFAAGCGKDKDENLPKVEVTVTPSPVPEDKTVDLVDMQKSTNDLEAIPNVIGNKTATASGFILINKTGDDIASINIRPHTEEEDASWGDDLINSRFVLKNNDKAAYYFDKNARDDSGKTITAYDIRIFYTDTDRYECYFRNLPFAKIKQLTLRMDGSGEMSLPFATYLGEGNTKEFSTLNEVKKRVGMMESYDSEEQEEEDQDIGTVEDPEVTPLPEEPTEEPENPDGGGSGVSDPISTSASYIGQSLDALKGVIGEPSGSDYQNEPETGETGYHYYEIGDSTFTVYTAVDENGNEIVAGVL